MQGWFVVGSGEGGTEHKRMEVMLAEYAALGGFRASD